ncbi:hypothetical protein HJFPF1_12594 [Paramyrothecium foliicola]|nr:hypothetical protein HJFPF1_12594 [Paramyrothecium foliicola]
MLVCGSEAGSCEECPVPTRTLTTTTTSTSTSTITSTVTEVGEEGGSYPDFTCLPVTVTNSDGAILELGEDCNFSFQPPSGPGSVETSTTASEADEAAPTGAALRLRQNCNPTRTATTTVTTTVPVTTRSTTTTTVTVAPSEEGFSCPEMVVTNTLGDELSLNDDCSLELTLGDGEDGSGGDQNGDGSNASGSGSEGNSANDAGNGSNNGTSDGGSSATGNRDSFGWRWSLAFLLTLMMQL